MTAYEKPELEIVALRAEERVATCTSRLTMTGPEGVYCDHPECWTASVDES